MAEARSHAPAKKPTWAWRRDTRRQHSERQKHRTAQPKGYRMTTGVSSGLSVDVHPVGLEGGRDPPILKRDGASRLRERLQARDALRE